MKWENSIVSLRVNDRGITSTFGSRKINADSLRTDLYIYIYYIYITIICHMYSIFEHLFWLGPQDFNSCLYTCLCTWFFLSRNFEFDEIISQGLENFGET